LLGHDTRTPDPANDFEWHINLGYTSISCAIKESKHGSIRTKDGKGVETIAAIQA
jgi:hypothetical protein